MRAMAAGSTRSNSLSSSSNAKLQTRIKSNSSSYNYCLIGTHLNKMSAFSKIKAAISKIMATRMHF